MARKEDGTFASGTSGNPGGRPKLIREFHKFLEDEAYPLAKQALLDLLVHEDGKVRALAMKEVHDRLFGKPRMEVTGEDGKPLAIALDLADVLRKLAE